MNMDLIDKNRVYKLILLVFVGKTFCEFVTEEYSVEKIHNKICGV